MFYSFTDQFLNLGCRSLLRIIGIGITYQASADSWRCLMMAKTQLNKI